jgi:hypothetical protein
VQVNIRAEQLDNERHRRAIGDEIEECFLSEQTWSQVKMVILRPADHEWSVEQRLRQAVACLDKALDRFCRQSIRNY